MSTPPKRERAGAGHTDPIERNDALAKAPAEYAGTDAGTTVRFDAERLSRRRFAGVRLQEIYAIALYRRRNDFVVDGITFVSALAFTLGCDEPSTLLAPGRGEYRGKKRRVPWMGLSLETLHRTILSAELGYFEDDELETVIASVEAWRSRHGIRPHSARQLGRDLQLTRIEREACNIRTIEAVDESKADRKARLKAEKLIRDREKKRADRGRIPRQIYEANSLSRTKPWMLEGIKRSAWYERRRTGVSRIIESQPATHLSGRTDSAGATGGKEPPAPGSDLLKRSEKNLSRMAPEESPLLSDAAAVIAAIREAESLLKAQRGRLRGKARDQLDRTLSLLPGLITIARWDADDPENLAACAEGAAFMLRHFSNDNDVAGIIRRLAA